MKKINGNTTTMRENTTTITTEASYTPLDVGFDLRVHPEMGIELPAGDVLRVRYMDGDEEKVAEGDRDHVASTLASAGYPITSAPTAPSEEPEPATETLCGITLHTVYGTDLYHQYPGQSGPQKCHVELDPEERTLRASYGPEIGNGVPCTVYHRLTLRWTIACLKGPDATDLMRDLTTHAAVICKGFERVWDGHNHVGQYDSEAEDEITIVAALCEQTSDDPLSQVQIWDASDYFGGMGGPAVQCKELAISGTETDEQIAELATSQEQSAASDGVDALNGCAKHLLGLRDYAREHVRCQCGEITGEHCPMETDIGATVVVEYMPEHLRSSHTAAGNSASYPDNGAVRIRCHEDCAEELVEADEEWVSIVTE